MARRSIILAGVTTSIHLDDVFWEELDRRAREKGMRWYDYTRALLASAEPVGNRSAAVREALFRALRTDLEARIGQVPAARWRLSGPGGDHERRTRGPRIRVGRSLDNEIVVNDPDVSRRHLLLAHDGEHWWVVDLDSRNGTWVGGKRVAACRMANETPIILGTSRLVRLE